jgi:hypothetical protein
MTMQRMNQLFGPIGEDLFEKSKMIWLTCDRWVCYHVSYVWIPQGNA